VDLPFRWRVLYSMTTDKPVSNLLLETATADMRNFCCPLLVYEHSPSVWCFSKTPHPRLDLTETLSLTPVAKLLRLGVAVHCCFCLFCEVIHGSALMVFTVHERRLHNVEGKSPTTYESLSNKPCSVVAGNLVVCGLFGMLGLFHVLVTMCFSLCHIVLSSLGGIWTQCGVWVVRDGMQR
jgi:hypothetical protein